MDYYCRTTDARRHGVFSSKIRKLIFFDKPDKINWRCRPLTYEGRLRVDDVSWSSQIVTAAVKGPGDQKRGIFQIITDNNTQIRSCGGMGKLHKLHGQKV